MSVPLSQCERFLRLIGKTDRVDVRTLAELGERLRPCETSPLPEVRRMPLAQGKRCLGPTFLAAA